MGEIIINESFPDDVEELFEKIENKEFESSELLNVKQFAEEVSKEEEINTLISYPMIKKNLDYELPHQSEGALKLLRELNATGLLADEVGLGKTITTGMLIKEGVTRGMFQKILVLTPPSLVDQWVAEMKEKFEVEFNIIEHTDDWEKFDLAIASLDKVKIYDKEQREFRHKKAHTIAWDLLIVDEAHKLKQRSTVRWKFVDMIQKKRFLILTATPFQNDLLELYNLLHLLKRGHLGTIKEFRKKYLKRGNKRYPNNPEELRKKLNELMVRRIRSQTSVKYMKRIPKIEAVKLTAQEYDIYNDIVDLLKNKYYTANGEKINGKLIVYAMLPKVTSSSWSAIESLKNIVADKKYHLDTRELAYEILQKYKHLEKDSKIEKLVEIIDKIYQEDKNPKILIYTKHPTTLRYIVHKLKPYNFKILEFMGGLDREGKTAIIKQFKGDANILISTETGAEGLNFQFCNNLINYDLPWNPMSVEQRIGRLDRIGQTRNMNIWSLATKDTMEEHVVDLIINKMCCVGLVIGELPIILFNLGLDERSESGMNKIEEMLMNSFIESTGTLETFASEVGKIGKIIEEGIKKHQEMKEATQELIDNEQRNTNEKSSD